MTIVREHLDRVLCSSEERLRISRSLRNQSRESIRRSHQAILNSQEVIHRSDQVIHDIVRKQCPEEEKPASVSISGPENLLQIVSGQTFEQETLVMDGKHFVDCVINGCVLEYSGQALVMESTQFNGCSFRFKGEAALTLNFLECFGLIPETRDELAAVPSPTARSQRPN